MYNPHKLIMEKALLAGYVCPSSEFQKWSFRMPMEEEAMSLSVLIFTIVFVIFAVAVTVSTQIHVSVAISFVLCCCFKAMSLVGIQP